jgi:hypothetical protein
VQTQGQEESARQGLRVRIQTSIFSASQLPFGIGLFFPSVCDISSNVGNKVRGKAIYKYRDKVKYRKNSMDRPGGIYFFSTHNF